MPGYGIGRRGLGALLCAALAVPRRAMAQPVAETGDLVVCPRGHPIATLSRSLVPGDPIGLSAFAGWRVPRPHALDPSPLCPVCRKAWYLTQKNGAGRPQVIVRGKGLQPPV